MRASCWCDETALQLEQAEIALTAAEHTAFLLAEITKGSEGNEGSSTAGDIDMQDVVEIGVQGGGNIDKHGRDGGIVGMQDGSKQDGGKIGKDGSKQDGVIGGKNIGKQDGGVIGKQDGGVIGKQDGVSMKGGHNIGMQDGVGMKGGHNIGMQGGGGDKAAGSCNSSCSNSFMGSKLRSDVPAGDKAAGSLMSCSSSDCDSSHSSSD